MKRLIPMLILLTLLAGCAAAEEPAFSALPIDFTPGPLAPEANYTENGYEDASLSVTMEKVTTDRAVFNVARVKIADPSQFRTWVEFRGSGINKNKISVLARQANAVVAMGGEFFYSDDTGYIVRMGEVMKNSKKKAYKTPIETRDLLFIDENGDMHILLRQRNKGQKTKVNPDFAEQLKALVTEHTPVNVFDFGPALIMDGAAVELPADYFLKPNAWEPRGAIGQVGPLEYVLVVVDTIEHHGRNNGQGATFATLQAFMADLGCIQAYNLDGGNSALMVFHGQNYSDKTVSEERSVSDIIYFATAVGGAQ